MRPGRVWNFEISPAWALGTLGLMLIPSLLVFLSLVLKAGVNRWVNIIAAVLYIVVGIGNSVGETWAFFIVGHAVGVVLLLGVVWTAVKWPQKES